MGKARGERLVWVKCSWGQAWRQRGFPRGGEPLDTWLTHLQQEGDSQPATQHARQVLQVPQQYPVASLGPEV